MTVKLVDVFVRKDGLTHEEFVDYWLNEHVELVEELPNLQKYATNVPKSLDGYEMPMPTDPADRDHDGIIELYFEDLDDLFEAFGSEAGRRLEEDVSEFADGSAGPTFIVEETETILDSEISEA